MAGWGGALGKPQAGRHCPAAFAGCDLRLLSPQSIRCRQALYVKNRPAPAPPAPPPRPACSVALCRWAPAPEPLPPAAGGGGACLGIGGAPGCPPHCPAARFPHQRLLPPTAADRCRATMGIAGLLPQLRSITRRAHVSKYRGQTSAWRGRGLSGRPLLSPPVEVARAGSSHLPPRRPTTCVTAPCTHSLVRKVVTASRRTLLTPATPPQSSLHPPPPADQWRWMPTACCTAARTAAHGSWWRGSPPTGTCSTAWAAWSCCWQRAFAPSWCSMVVNCPTRCGAVQLICAGGRVGLAIAAAAHPFGHMAACLQPLLNRASPPTPPQADEERSRERSREEHKARARALWAQGNKAAAMECYQKAVDIQPAHAKQFVEVGAGLANQAA